MKTRVCRLHDKHDIRIETDIVASPGSGEVLVAIGAGGICGSDLHYYHDGGFGPIQIREPMILGHEVAGVVEAIGEGVSTVNIGAQVALNPSRACGQCSFCAEGLQQHCHEMLFFGSAMRFPHVQGAFRERIIVQASQCEIVGPHVSLAEAACAEPLAVCVHARNQAIRTMGELKGKRVLITGSGPIGALSVAVARHAGAKEIVVTDLQDATLRIAKIMGADRTINVMNDSGAMDEYSDGKGHFDLALECSAAPMAIKTALSSVRPQGTIVQIGIGGDTQIPLNLLVGKEINLFGTHRFHSEYAEAVGLIDSGAINVKPIITGSYPLEEAVAAFEAAGDRSKSVKVQLRFS